MSFRDIKKTARRQLHEKLKVPALYIVGEDDPLPVFVRVHSEWRALGEVGGTSFDYAEKQEVVPRIIFDRLEVPTPTRLAIVSVSAEEAWRLDHRLPPDGEFVTATASRILPAEIATLDLPVP